MVEVDDRTAALLRVGALLAGALDTVNRMVAEGPHPMNDDDRLLLSAAITLATELDAKSHSDSLHWARCYLAGHEGWLVLRSLPERPPTARYYGALSREQRTILGR